MPALSSFNNFVLATGNKLKTSPDQIFNDAVKNTYMISRMLKGQTPASTIQSGARIIDRIMLNDAGTAVFYDPNADLDIQNVDTMREIRVDWRFLADHFSYTEQEVTLNSGDQQTYYKNLLMAKRQGAVTGTFNFMEEALWATASNANMEAQNGTVPYSILAFVTEAPGGVAGGAPTGFTTVMGANPTTEPRWRNQTETYDATDLTNPDSGLVNAFDNMFMKTKFRAPRSQQEYFESDELQQMCIVSNRDGRALWLRLTRDSNDRLVGNDLGAQQAGLSYAGLPVEYIATLDDTYATAGQPRYLWLNLKYLHPIWHSEQYMKEKAPMSHPRQPFSSVVWSSTYYNLWCHSRRRQGMVYPA